MNALRRRLLVLAAALAVGPVSGQTTTLFSDDLSSDNKWVYFSATAVRSNGEKLLVDDGQHAIAFFSGPGGGKQKINVNESLQVSLTLSFTNVANSPTGMRIGLFDSNIAGLPPADTPSTSQEVFQGYDGFMVHWNAGATTANNNLGLRWRTPATASTSLMSNSLATTFSSAIYPATTPPLVTFQVGIDYQVSYSVSRGAGSALTFSFAITGAGITQFGQTAIINSPTTDEFNAFAILSAAGASDFAIDNVLITHTTPVPEPSTYAACAGAAVLGLAFWRRRRAAAKAAVA